MIKFWLCKIYLGTLIVIAFPFALIHQIYEVAKTLSNLMHNKVSKVLDRD